MIKFFFRYSRTVHNASFGRFGAKIGRLLTSESVYKVPFKNPFLGYFVSKLTKFTFLRDIEAFIVEKIIDQF